jgi:EAL domain-containing protein (putative c-di-GMP-specific phosphodiesterase class I)
LFYDQISSVDDLLRRADIAMYDSKSSGRNKVRFFDPDMQKTMELRASLEDDLRSAITKGQLKLYYQIQLNQQRQPIGAEALVRWIHPTRGMVPPNEFIPVAEDSSLIVEIGNWVLESACAQIALWSKDKKTSKLVIAANISAKQFVQPDFVNTIDTLLKKHKIEPSRLKLELTESVLIEDIKSVVTKMNALRDTLGVGLSLDDFGTGYSSLSYLKQLPLDQVKIDQSFVRDMTTDASDAIMVKNIIDMAHNFGLNVIAEGVETEEQLNLLKKNGCKSYQGYLFSKPIPVEHFEEMLQDIALSIPNNKA